MNTSRHPDADSDPPLPTPPPTTAGNDAANRAPSAVPLLIVDAANVVGSVPDGWWRDRAGATTRLRDALVGTGTRGLLPPDAGAEAGADADADTRPGNGWDQAPPYEVVLVVEGAARRVASAGDVRVVAAPGSGDDAIVDLVRRERPRRAVLVVTADRGLRRRVLDLGADVAGPRTVRRIP